MTFELSYVFSNEAIDANYDGNSHPVDPALLWIGGTDYSGDPPYYQILERTMDSIWILEHVKIIL